MKAFIVRSLLILVSLVLLVQLWIFSSLVWWRTHPVDTTMMMRLDYWSEPSKPIEHQWRDYDQISDYLKHAVVAAEDGKFLQHHGFDWAGMQFALERNKDKGKVVAGGSTISQQLAKNLFHTRSMEFGEDDPVYMGLLMKIDGVRTVVAKVKEFIDTLNIQLTQQNNALR